MAKYQAKVGSWISPSETTGSIQNLGNSPIEISSTNTENTGIKLESGQMVNFEGTVFVRSMGNRPSTFTTVPFKVIAGGGGGGGGETYTLPTASFEIKGGIKIGDRVSISDEKLSADIQIDSWKTETSYKIGNIVVNDNKLYRCTTNHTSDIFSSDISNWIAIKSSIENWSASKFYEENSSVIHNNILYICNTAHTSSSVFDSEKWTKIGETFVTKLDNWATNVDYVINQIVYYGNSIYRCKTAHTSSVFSTDIAKWEQVYSDIKEWNNDIYYPVGTIVINDNKLYSCKTAHTSGISFDDTKWNLLSSSVGDFSIENWATGISYKSGNIVLYNSVLYVCNTDHVSTSFSSDISNWNVIYSYLMSWSASTYYPLDAVIIYNNKIYKCINAHTSSSSFDNTKFIALSSDSSINTWNGSTSYSVGDIVISDDDIYRCITAHTSGNSFNSDIVKWEKIYAIHEWKANTNYFVGELVKHNNNYYFVENTFTSGVSFDETNLSPLKVTFSWESNTYYAIGVVKVANDKLWRCSVAHMSGLEFDLEEEENWVEISKSDSSLLDWTTGVTYNVGDIVVYGDNLYRCNTVHTSTTWDSDIVKWEVLNSIDDWISNTNYFSGQIIRYNNHYFIVNLSFNSGSTFSDVNLSPLKVTFSWEQQMPYLVGAVVVADDKFWRCITAHTSGNSFNIAEQANWVQISKTTIENWTTGINYTVNQFVIFNGSIFRCNTAHTSSSHFTDDSANWDLVTSDLRLWKASTRYMVGTIVINDNKLYRCNTEHVSNVSFNSLEEENWDIISGWIVATTAQINNLFI